MRRLRPLAVALTVALLAAACTGSADTAATTTASTTTTTSTTVPPSTAPPLSVEVALEGAPAGLVEVVEQLYQWAAAPSSLSPPDLAEGLVTHLADLEDTTGRIEVTGTVSVGAVLDTSVAVIEAGEDVVLAVADPSWRIVGARLSSFGKGAWYGEEPRLVLIIGSDARPGQNPLGYRADSLHIVTTVPSGGEGAIVGIPRDSWVEASYGANAKITNVMASRGPEVVLDTLRNVTGLALEGYLVTGFAGFTDLVDAFGGFEFDVPFAMAEPKSKAYFEAGLQLFTGADALAFARNRTLSGGDLTRSYHQGLLMVAALRKVRDLGIGQLPSLLEILTEYTWTDLSSEQLLTLAAASYDLDPETLPNIVVDGQVGTAGSASVVFLTEAAFATFEDLDDGLLTPAD